MKTIYLLVVLAAFAACALIVFHQRKQWEKFFLARGFRPIDVNDISARVGGAMAALFTPGK